MNWKLTLAILTSSAVMMSSSYTMLIPFLPMYLIEELGVPMSDVNWWSGVIFSTTFLISGIMAPIWGALADKKSRKLMAVRAAACLAISYAWGGLVSGPWELFWMRAFQGFSSGLWPATLAIMSAQAPRQRLGLCMGVMQAGLTAGHVLGPMMGGMLAEAFGMRASFLLAGGLLALITLLILVCIKEPPRAEAAAPAAAGEAPEARPHILRQPGILVILLAAAAVQLSILMTQPVLPLYIGELQGSMDKVVLVAGIVFSIVGVPGVIASPVWGILGQNWGFRKSLYVALVLSGVFGVVQAIPHDLVQFTAWRFVGGLTFAGIFPALNALLTQMADPADRGRAFGYSYCFQQFGGMLGPIAGGALATVWGNQAAIMMSGAMLLPLALWLWLVRPKQPRDRGSGRPVAR